MCVTLECKVSLLVCSIRAPEFRYYWGTVGMLTLTEAIPGNLFKNQEPDVMLEVHGGLKSPGLLLVNTGRLMLIPGYSTTILKSVLGIPGQSGKPDVRTICSHNGELHCSYKN